MDSRLSNSTQPISASVAEILSTYLDAMWEKFVAFGNHWRAIENLAPLRSRFDSFLDHRIALMLL
jgi:hypothetical protein